MRLRIHSRPITATPITVASSWPATAPATVPRICGARTRATYCPVTTAASAANTVRSTTATAAATRPAREPNASCTRDDVPPGMSSAQLSMSMARANQPMTAVASTAHTVCGPSTGAATPATKKRPAPSCAMARAAAFHTDTNDSTAGVDRTTRTGYGVRRRGVSGIVAAGSSASRVSRRGPFRQAWMRS